METDIDHAGEMIENGGVGVLPTDTLYGLVASAFNVPAVERIYNLKQRSSDKPLIVLISDIAQLEQFGVVVGETLTEKLSQYWPGAYSIIIPTLDEQFEYIHRGEYAIAFRLPDNEMLQDLISITGPIVAPSANPEGMPPPTTTQEARVYFGTDVDFYVDGGELKGKASTILSLDGDEVVVVRE